jgi:hypothetical protein
LGIFEAKINFDGLLLSDPPNFSLNPVKNKRDVPTRIITTVIGHVAQGAYTLRADLQFTELLNIVRENQSK